MEMEDPDDDALLKKIYMAIENRQNILLHSPGGTGKSHILRTIAQRFTFRGKNVAMTATTGVAAINLSSEGPPAVAGATINGWAGIGLAKDPPQRLASNVRHRPDARKRWIETDILIIDEISMAGAELLDKLDFVGRDIRRERSLPFGGLQIIVSGDFLQLPPVNDKFAFKSYVWGEISDTLTPFILDKPKRYSNLEWFQMLLRFRSGTHTPEDIKFLRSREVAYQDYVKKLKDKDDVGTVKPTVLHSRRADVDYQNEVELTRLGGKQREIIADDIFTAYNNHARSDHYIKPLEDAIPRFLCFKVGAQVMLRANLDIPGGLANGSRGVVVEIIGEGTSPSQGGIKVKWLKGNTTTVTAHTWTQEDKDGKATRTHIPLILAWAMTIHRTQGCTLDYAICDIGPSVFCPGQAYVALSRVRDPSGLFLSEFYPPSIKVSEEALNYVSSLEGGGGGLRYPQEPPEVKVIFIGYYHPDNFFAKKK